MRTALRSVGAGLLVLFAGLLPSFSVAAGSDPTRSGFTATWLPWMPVVFVVLFVFFLSIGLWRLKPLQAASSLLSANKPLEVLKTLEQRGARKHLVGHALAGLAYAQLWKTQAAVDELDASLAGKGAWRSALKSTLPTIHHTRALGLAVLGRADEARRAVSAVPTESVIEGMSHLTEAVLLVRAGDFDRALPLTNTVAVRRLGGTAGELGRALEAMCTERLTHQPQRVDRVAFFGEASPDELRRVWPELVAFVERG